MSGIYIKGFEMPEIEVMNGISLCLFKSYGGDIRIRNNGTGEVFDVFPVPDHGDLKDAAYIEAENDRRFDFACATEEIAEHEYAYAYHVVASILATAPTVIPADKEDKP